ncbi:hypothetical protein FEK35_27140 [Nocardia cyriacigeorgica]|uniref:Uncharacterized protein n=1 Tax=Nocardia cyriacigeorgica TaxID=135487 RepID=A0A5R8P6V1_9NOCA|nr:hypothetical protein [Nocardia cyriacigeorgica]TLF96769.1 hypothetical protein FEK35_27140 [Nocardia cyriacigeorgica]
MNETQKRRQILADAVRARRKELKLTQGEIQAAGGPSTATLRMIEGAKPVDFRASTTNPLEDALGWPRGTIADVLNGKRKTVEAAAQPRNDHQAPAAAGPTEADIDRGQLIYLANAVLVLSGYLNHAATRYPDLEEWAATSNDYARYAAILALIDIDQNPGDILQSIALWSKSLASPVAPEESFTGRPPEAAMSLIRDIAASDSTFRSWLDHQSGGNSDGAE